MSRRKAHRADVTVGVIICAHSTERLDLLRGAIGSVLDQSAQPLEVLVVIDHNPPLAETIRAEFSALRVIENVGERGLSGARNTGIQSSNAAVVAFLDDDAAADPDWVGRLAAHYADPHVMAVGGRVQPIWPQGRPAWFPREFDWVVGCSYLGLPETASDVRNLIGCNMSFRRAIFAQAGLFREKLGRLGNNGAGCEETDLCIRASQTFPASRIVFDPAVGVRHHIAHARTGWSYFRNRCLAEGRSKAQMTRALGTRKGLASERRHVTRILPQGVLRGLADTVRDRNIAGARRAVSIVAGLGYVLWGYLSSRGRQGPSQEPSQGTSAEIDFAPIRVVDLDLANLPQSIAATDPKTGIRYGGAFCVVRANGRPVRIAQVPLYGEDTPTRQIAGLLGLDDPIERPDSASAQVMAQPPFARVVIATRDRAQSLAVCLDSLLAQDYSPFEILVVDNAPASSETMALVSERYAATGRVHYVREDRAGLGQAHNRGIGANAAQFVAFTDDDVLVDSHWLGALAENFMGSPNVGCVTGMILPAELETRAQYWTELHGGFGKGLERRVFDLEDNREAGILFPFAAGSFGSGANMAFSRETLSAIGGFDGALGAGTVARGGDDLAAFVSVIRAGYQLVYEPQAIVWHHHRRSEEGMRRQAYGYGVGLGAYLTKFIVDDPRTVLHYARALPAGLAHILFNASPKNARLPDDYPDGLRWSERFGMVAGVPAYLRSKESLRSYFAAMAKSDTVSGPAGE